MPALTWIGKEAVERRHEEAPFHLLRLNEELSAGDPESGNLLVQGDNLLALKALLPRYAGRVKCVYIDPPYNTGSEEWVYNDNVNSPEMRDWLGKVVGKEAEDLSRHDKWLCMMYPRLRLLKDFLRKDGVLFASVNDVEASALELVCREIFGHGNFLARLVWNTEGNTDNQLEVKINHEYVLMFLKNVDYKQEAVGHVVDPNTREDSNLWKGLADNNINKNNPANPPTIFTIPAGFPSAEKRLFYPAKKVDEKFFELTKERGMIPEEIKSEYGIENLSGLPVKLDDLVVEDFRVQRPCRVYGGFANRRKLGQFVKNGFRPVADLDGPISFYLNRNAAIRYSREAAASRNILSVLRNVGTTERTRTELRNMGVVFNYPKPVPLIQYLLSFGAADRDSIVLDCFAGSGTTGHAVLQLNNQDGGSRRFVLVEMDGAICRDTTAKRLARVVGGYEVKKKGGRAEEVAGLGGGFRYCELAEPLFDERRRVRAGVSFGDLARHIFFVETGRPLPERNGRKRTPLLGSANGVGVYLLHDGGPGGSVLTDATLKSLPPHAGPKIVYAAGRRVGDTRLRREGVTFKQVSYDIKSAGVGRGGGHDERPCEPRVRAVPRRGPAAGRRRD